ncbi:uncharacterized protein J3R85_006506 [Psidium guajava]|nr:uncharacterized protein J3R85_006506 [Psidium guajava]
MLHFVARLFLNTHPCASQFFEDLTVAGFCYCLILTDDGFLSPEQRWSQHLI